MNLKRANECFTKQSPVLWNDCYWQMQELNLLHKVATLRRGDEYVTIPLKEIHD